MGSGKEAKKASKTAITMLEKLLTSGFDKDTSLRLINSSLLAIGKEDMYATLDVAVLDLYAQKLEFIKNGACPTYVKHGRNVEVLRDQIWFFYQYGCRKGKSCEKIICIILKGI